MIEQMTINQLLDGYRKREFSPVEITTSFLQRIHSFNKELNAFITVTAEEALQQAKRSELKFLSGDEIGTLEGIPISFKDLIDIKGIQTTNGSKVYPYRIPDQHASVTNQLLNAGAVSLGKTNLDEFALGTTSENPFFGTVKNPWNPELSAGGSSGGSAVAVVASLGVGSIGTDTGGSIRIPSALCGVVGLKPTYGTIHTSGVTGISWTLDHVGPIARNVRDTAAIAEVLLGGGFSFGEQDDADLRGVRIGVPLTFFNENIEEEALRLYHQSIEQMEALGASIVNISLPISKQDTEYVFILEKAEGAHVHKENMKQHLYQYSNNVRDFLSSSTSISASEYIDALKRKENIQAHIQTLFHDVDAIVTPTLPAATVKRGTDEIKFAENESIFSCMIRYTSIFNMSGHPTLSIPCGISADGSPVGLQLTASYYNERNLFKFASAYEKHYLQDFYEKRDNLVNV